MSTLFVFAFSLLVCFSTVFSTKKKVMILGNGTKVDIPVTYYVGQIQFANVAQNDVLYYSVKLCEKGIKPGNMATLAISLPDNTMWTNLGTFGFVMVQISICPNGNFNSQCVIGQNYVWGTTIKAVPEVTWNLNDYSSTIEYYFRVLAGNIPTQFSMELSFSNNANPFSYPWTTNFPFGGDSISGKIPSPLSQYWKSVAEYQVKNRQLAYFAFAYCNQGYAINGITIGTLTPIEFPHSLVDQYACPQQFVNYTECTQPNAEMYGWVNSRVASFNVLRCSDTASKKTDNGIWLVVEGDGGEADQINHFSVQASIILA